ncbi:MAG: hypothetical protein O3B86_07805, partial [Planctomycetota bacterium]|nr:hypothetical protein [Planctomycetota bacterium]
FEFASVRQYELMVRDQVSRDSAEERINTGRSKLLKPQSGKNGRPSRIRTELPGNALSGQSIVYSSKRA